MKSNSQIQLSNRLYLGDIDGDLIDELIEVDGRHIYVYKANADHTPVLEYVFPAPVQRLIIGDFVSTGREHNKDQILGILDDGSIRGYAISDDLTEMWWWFTQPNFIKSNEHYIVGDFDGDGADEIMVYKPSTGTISIFEKKKNGVFDKMKDWSLGNLRSYNRKNKLLIAGNFGQASERSDLLVIDRGAGQVARFDTATKKGIKTFWWAFTSKNKRFHNKDDLCVANLDGGSKDGLVVRSHGTGRYKFYALEYNGGNLQPASNVQVGQLPVKPKNGGIIAAKVRDLKFRNEYGGKKRDDILFFNDKNNEFIRTDARYDSSKKQLIHWWAYTTNLIFEPQVAPLQRPWAVMLCRFKGLPGDPLIEEFFREMFTPGHGGMIEYWHDVSLGAVDISKSRVFGWIELDIKRSEAEGKSRGSLIDAAIAATKKIGNDPEKGFYKQIAVFTHDFSRDGAPEGASWRDPVWGQYWVDGSADGKGRVSAPPHGHSGSFVAHEMGHGMGFNHDLKANLTSQYGDPNCIMSAMAVRTFRHSKWNRVFGPTMSFPQLWVKNWMFKRRIHKVSKRWVSSSAGVTFDMAPLSDRRLNAHLGAILPVNSSGSWDYYLEYMQPTGWNQGLQQARLVIRRLVKKNSAYLGEIITPTKTGQKQSWIEPSGNVYFEIEKLRADERIVRVTVKKL